MLVTGKRVIDQNIFEANT